MTPFQPALIAIAICIIACAIGSAQESDNNQDSISWQNYLSEKGGFQIELPGKPIEQSRKFKPTPDSEIEMRMYLVNEIENQVVFVIAYHDLTNKPSTEAEIDDVLQGGMQGALVNVNGQLDQQEDIKVHDAPARHFTFTGKQGTKSVHGTFRIVLRGNRIYQLSVMRLADAKLPANATQRFLDSFEFTEIKRDNRQDPTRDSGDNQNGDDQKAERTGDG